MRAYVLANGGFQLFDTSEDTLSNAFVSQFGEPSLHEVDPGTVGGDEMSRKARPFGKPIRIIAVLWVL
jgi:hypothetical protein